MPERNDIYRVMTFVDYWELQSSLDEVSGGRFLVDWERFPLWLATDAVGYAHDLPAARLQLDETNVYLALDPTHPEDAELKEWAVGVLGRQPKVQVILGDRVKGPSPCNACHFAGTPECRHCRAGIAGTGGQTTTDMMTVDIFRRTREKAFDVAVIVSSDTALIPAAKYLQAKGVSTFSFPPLLSASSDISGKEKKVWNYPGLYLM